MSASTLSILISFSMAGTAWSGLWISSMTSSYRCVVFFRSSFANRIALTNEFPRSAAAPLVATTAPTLISRAARTSAIFVSASRMVMVPSREADHRAHILVLRGRVSLLSSLAGQVQGCPVGPTCRLTCNRKASGWRRWLSDISAPLRRRGTSIDSKWSHLMECGRILWPRESPRRELRRRLAHARSHDKDTSRRARDLPIRPGRPR